MLLRDLASTSTIYAYVACSKVIKAFFIQSRRWLSRNWSAKIPELPTLWYSILRNVRRNPFFEHGVFPLREVIICSCLCLRTPAVSYTVICRPFTTAQIYSPPIACCFFILLLPVLRTIFKFAFWGICLVATLAASWWAYCCLRFCCVQLCDLSAEMSFVWLNSDPVTPGWCVCVSMGWWCGIGEDDDRKKKWEVLRNILLPTCQDDITSSQVVRYAQVDCCCVWLYVEGVTHCPVTNNKSVRCC